MGSLPPLALAGAIVVCLGELLHIVGLATTSWMTAGNNESGLFRACIGDICGNIKDASSELEAVQAMCIIGMLAGLVAAGCAVVYLVFNIMSKSTPSIMGLATLGSAIAAFVFIIIGVIVYAAKIYNDGADYGFSFGLTITGGVLLLIGGILFFQGSKQTE